MPSQLGTYPEIFIKTYGCAQSRYEAQWLELILLKKGILVYRQPFGSDKQFFRNNEEEGLIRRVRAAVIFGCPITKYLEKFTGDYVAYLKKINKKAKILLSGCVLSSDYRLRKWANDVTDGSLILMSADDIPEYLDRSSKNKRRSLPIKKMNLCEPGVVLIKRGCSQKCTYCICHHLNFPRNFGLKDIVGQLNYLRLEGFKNVEFAGSCYGRWRDPEGRKLKFADLVEYILSKKYFRIVNLEIHPGHFSDKLTELVHSTMVDKEISVPMQSASSRTLRKMDRGYDREYIFKLFSGLFRRVPQLKLTTDIIVGFPGERADDFEDTVHLLECFPFHRIDVYPYSQLKTSCLNCTDKNPRWDPEMIKKKMMQLYDNKNLRDRLNITSTMA